MIVRAGVAQKPRKRRKPHEKKNHPRLGSAYAELAAAAAKLRDAQRRAEKPKQRKRRATVKTEARQ